MNRLMQFLFVLITLSGLASASFGQQQEITGAGAAFPHALYSKMFDTYNRECGVRVSYETIGSGGGIRQLIEQTVDFGASDKVMGEEDMKATGAPIVHVPVCAGSVGYTELRYALRNKMAYCSVKNRRGNFVRPSIASTGAAMNVSLPSDMTVNLTDTEAAAGYPLAGFTWFLLYREQAYRNRTEAKAKELVRLIWWMTHEGQKYAEPLQYAPLSKAAVTKAEALIRFVTYDGEGLLR